MTMTLWFMLLLGYDVEQHYPVWLLLAASNSEVLEMDFLVQIVNVKYVLDTRVTMERNPIDISETVIFKSEKLIDLK